jgi:hypothetical protein
MFASVYCMVRLALVLIGLVLLWVCIRHRKKKGKKRIWYLALIYGAMVILMLFPLENWFFEFKCPENVVRYTYGGEVLGVTEGEDSCFVLFDLGGSTTSTAVFRKTESGYQLPAPYFPHRIAYENKTGFSLYGLPNSQDRYLFGQVICGENGLDIRDSYGTDFTYLDVLERHDSNAEGEVYYVFAPIPDSTDPYTLYINGQPFTFRSAGFLGFFF